MSLRNQFAVSMNLSYLTAMLISLRLRVSYASDPLPNFQRHERAEYTIGGLRYEHFGFRLMLAHLTGRKVVPPRRSHHGGHGEAAERARRPLLFSML